MNNLLRFGALLVGIAGAVAFYFLMKEYPVPIPYLIIAGALFVIGMLTAGRGDDNE